MIETLAFSLDGSYFTDVWSYLGDNWEELLRGLRRTLQVSAIAIAGAFVIGLVLGAARAARLPVVSQLAAVYVEIIRNTPILVQIFFLYFAPYPSASTRRVSPSASVVWRRSSTSLCRSGAGSRSRRRSTRTSASSRTRRSCT